MEVQRLLSSGHAADYWTYASNEGVHVRKGKRVKREAEKLGSSKAQQGPVRPGKAPLLHPGAQAVLCTPGTAGPPSLSLTFTFGL